MHDIQGPILLYAYISEHDIRQLRDAPTTSIKCHVLIGEYIYLKCVHSLQYSLIFLCKGGRFIGELYQAITTQTIFHFKHINLGLYCRFLVCFIAFRKAKENVLDLMRIPPPPPGKVTGQVFTNCLSGF